MRLRRSRTLALILAMSALPLCVLTCSDDEEKKVIEPDPNTPFPYARLSVESMTPNLEDLDQQADYRSPQGVCHALSALVVAWVNLNVAVRLAVPIAAIDACLLSPSVYIGNNTWTWTASGGQGSQAWTAELMGQLIDATNVRWSMRVSGTQLELDRFLWFEGTCDTRARAGVWHYFDPASPETSRELVRCDWSLPEEPNGGQQIGFENVEPGGNMEGDQLLYTLADSIAAVSLTDASEETTMEARWDLRTGEGRAISARADTCCWGPRPFHPDVECP
ncbi:MAG: hypothetical protein FJY88_03610 [Candidatus Eisenbacteria bacterium]|nr:hypothetical protein [Candidatus Eisenbacteria bacterium]